MNYVFDHYGLERYGVPRSLIDRIHHDYYTRAAIAEETGRRLESEKDTKRVQREFVAFDRAFYFDSGLTEARWV